jgi:ABC-type glycerol-3-phosphate transport system substrate-binding protein
MEHKKLSRRMFLKLSAGAGATALLAACQPKAPTATEEPEEMIEPTATPEPVEEEPTPETHSRTLGEGETEIVVWYQDWEGANRMMDRASVTFTEKHPEAKVNLQAIGYSDLFSKMLPAIAAGTEGDVMNMYTNWIVGTDIKQVYLDITDAVGGYTSFIETFWEAPLTTIDMPEGKIYYLPWLAGIRGAVITVNREHLAEDDIDYLNFQTWEEVIDAGKKLTKWDGDTMTRAGYAINSSQHELLYNIIWQLGGNMYDKQSGKWSWHTEEGVEAAQWLYDIYWTHKTSSYDLYTDEYQGVSEGLISMWGDGAWTAGVQNQTADIDADNIVTPPIAGAVNDDLHPDHIAGFGLSKRLADDRDKLQIALDFALTVTGPDALVQAFDDYSGVCMSKAVYDDPRIEEVKFGPMSKRIATGMWPRGRYNADHVADMGPSNTELDRALRGEISIPEALENMDAYCQEQEDAARERIGI